MPVAVVLGLFVACFSGVIFEDRLFAFRDAAHFYYPLFAYIQQTWEAGQLPWWNPYENGGMPIGANPAASLFYPGKAIFFLVRDFDTAYRVYVLAHLLLAAFWAYRLARHWQTSRPAATLAAITYTFSGAVLIQYSNVIFLVGAAWLPAGVLVADRMLRHRRKRDAFLLGTVCALVTLGGDPQTAYHLGLLVLLLIALRAMRRRALVVTLRKAMTLRKASGAHQVSLAAGFTPAFSESENESKSAGANLPVRLGPAANKVDLWKLLAITLITGLVLAAVQIVPTVRYLMTTDRSSDQVARSLYEVPRMIGKDEAGRRIADGLLCRHLDRPGHSQSVYEFSVGPWRFAELVWPNCFGRQFPLHRRWIQALPGEGRVWTPTLYAGIIPLGFALGAFRLQRRKRHRKRRLAATAGGALHRRWMSWTLLLGLVGSLGYYGVVWLVEEIAGPIAGADGTSVAGPPVGGLYWLMNVVLPGYIYFRYPAKLLVLVSLGLAMLAARGWDDFFSARRLVRTGRIFFGFMLISLVVIVSFLFLRPVWSAWVSTAPACPIFGPLDVEGAFYDTFFGLVQTAVVSGIAWILLRASTFSRGACPRDFGGTIAEASPAAKWRVVLLLLVLAAFDVGLANRWIVATAPAELWRTRLPISVEHVFSAEGDRIVQVYRWPRLHDPRWKEHGSVDRLAEEVRWNCQTLYPKYNLLQRIGVVDSYGTMMPAAHRELLRGTPVQVMRTTGATIAILPHDAELPGGERLLIGADFKEVEFSIWRLEGNDEAPN